MDFNNYRYSSLQKERERIHRKLKGGKDPEKDLQPKIDEGDGKERIGNEVGSQRGKMRYLGGGKAIASRSDWHEADPRRGKMNKTEREIKGRVKESEKRRGKEQT